MNFCYTGDSLQIFDAGESRSISATHLNFGNAVDLCLDGKLSEAWELADASEALVNYSSRRISIRDGVLFYTASDNREYEFHDVVVDRLIEAYRENREFGHLENFILKLLENPANHVHSGLYEFLNHRYLPILENGNFLAYKSLRGNGYDWHSNSVLNEDGVPVEMPRSMVDDDRSSHCSKGYHVGGWEYVTSFGGYDKIIKVVEVDPRDVVCIPHDHNCLKARVCKYVPLYNVTEPIEIA